MKVSTLAIIVLVAFGIGLAVGMAVSKKYDPCTGETIIEVQRDTTIVTDTVHAPVPAPKTKIIVKWDTLKPADEPKGPSLPDTPAKPEEADSTPRITPEGNVVLPITSKVYQTNDYRATVSGFRPKLDSIEIYRKNTVVRETVTKLKRPRWALTAGVGAGYTPERAFVPTAGVSLGFVIWSK